MSAKVDTTSAVEPHSTKMSGSSTSSAPTTSSQKVSMFAVKSGFVIPKNKLSGSLIPIIRGGKKLGSGDAADEESTKLLLSKRDEPWLIRYSDSFQVMFCHLFSNLISLLKVVNPNLSKLYTFAPFPPLLFINFWRCNLPKKSFRKHNLFRNFSIR